MCLYRFKGLIFRLLAIGPLLAGSVTGQGIAGRGSMEGRDLFGAVPRIEVAKNVALVGHIDGDFQELQVDGDLAYAAAGEMGLLIIDISDPTQPVVVGSYLTNGRQSAVISLVVSNWIAFVVDEWSGLYLIDVSDPSQPTQLGLYQAVDPNDEEANYGHVFVNEEIVYLSVNKPIPDWCFCGEDSYYLYVLDASSPANPVFLSSYQTSNPVTGITVRGGIAFLGDGDLRVLDVSDPAYPAEIGQLVTIGHATGQALNGEILFIADGYKGLLAVDVIDPAHPVQIGSFEPPPASNPAIFNRVEITGDLAYMADRNYGLRVFYIQDPGHPGAVGRYPVNGNATDVDVEGDLIFLAQSGGLEILKYTGPEVFYQVSGKVTSIHGGPIYGVTISAGGWGLTKTGTDGTFALTGLEPGSYTLTALGDGYMFSPSDRSISVPPDGTGQDFVGESGWLFLPFVGGR